MGAHPVDEQRGTVALRIDDIARARVVTAMISLRHWVKGIPIAKYVGILRFLHCCPCRFPKGIKTVSDFSTNSHFSFIPTQVRKTRHASYLRRIAPCTALEVSIVILFIVQRSEKDMIREKIGAASEYNYAQDQKRSGKRGGKDGSKKDDRDDTKDAEGKGKDKKSSSGTKKN